MERKVGERQRVLFGNNYKCIYVRTCLRTCSNDKVFVADGGKGVM